MSVAGTYDFSVSTPMGDQKGQLTIEPVGSSEAFTGAITGALGSLPIAGRIEGDTVNWKMETTVPMPLQVECMVTIAGENLSGKAKAGFFGEFAMTGKRVG